MAPHRFSRLGGHRMEVFCEGYALPTYHAVPECYAEGHVDD